MIRQFIPRASGRGSSNDNRSASSADAIRAITLSIVLIASALAVPTAMVGVASATESATIVAEPATTNTTSTHTVHAMVESEDNATALQDLDIDYNSATIPSKVSEVGMEDITKVGIDKDADGTIDKDLSSSVSSIEYNNNGHTITFLFDGTYILNASDTVIIAYQDVVNPSEPGDYQTQIAVNHGSTDHPSKASLSITSNTSSSGGSSDTTQSDPSVEVQSASVDPSTVSPGETVKEQTFTFTVHNVSGDGHKDTFYVQFPDELANDVTPVDASVLSGPAGMSDSPDLADGYDGDGRLDTVMFRTDDGSGSPSDLKLELKAEVEYPDQSGATYDISIRAEDSDGDTDTATGITSVSTTDSNSNTNTATDTTPPSITGFNVWNPSGTTLEVTFESSESLSNIEVDISGDASVTLTEDDFSSTSNDGVYTYTATYDPGLEGSYTATLTDATDDAGNDGADGESDSVTVTTSDTSTETSSSSGGSGGGTGGGGAGTGGSGGSSTDGGSSADDSSDDGSIMATSTPTPTPTGDSQTTPNSDDDDSRTTDVPTSTPFDSDPEPLPTITATETPSENDDSGGFPGLLFGGFGSLLLIGGLAIRERERIREWIEGLDLDFDFDRF